VPVSPPPAALPTKAVADKARVWKSALVAIFLACLLAPSLDLAFGVDHNPSPARDVVSFPRPRLDRSLLKWPGNLLWYLKSNMGFRGALVRAHGRFVWSVLGGSPAPESVLRADPWLFLKSERVPDDFRRVDPFSDADLGRWSEVLEGRRRWLAARGIRYLIVIAPNKETVYAGAVPPWVTRAPGPSRLAQLVARVRATTAVEIADLTAPLEKATARVYHLTDTHWNDLGAFVGYRSVIEHLEPWFKELRPLDRSDMVDEEEVTRGGDMARVCGLQLDLREPQMRLALRPGVSEGARFADGSPLTFDRIDVRGRQRFVTRAPRGEIASAVILRDSFGEALIPYLSRHFQTATWIWTYDFPASEIETDRPALVIEQLVERKLMVLAPQNPAEVANP
jgi:hypothetical protein